MSVLSSFYRWAEAEGHAAAVPFSYAQAQARFAGSVGGASVNLARRRVPKRHVTIKYLEPGFADLFVRALAGLGPDGTADAAYRGRELARNSAVARLALATGLRRQEFTFLLACELPPLPGPGPGDGGLPIPFGVPAGVTKGGKFRTTWVDYPALEAAHRYASLDRAASVAGSAWSPPAASRQSLPLGRQGHIRQIDAVDVRLLPAEMTRNGLRRLHARVSRPHCLLVPSGRQINFVHRPHRRYAILKPPRVFGKIRRQLLDIFPSHDPARVRARRRSSPCPNIPVENAFRGADVASLDELCIFHRVAVPVRPNTPHVK